MLNRFLKLLGRAGVAWITRDEKGLCRQKRLLALHLLADNADRITFHRAGTTWTTAVTGNIGKRLFLRGGYQEQHVEALVRWTRESGHFSSARDWIIDVGANIGSPSIPFARRTAGRVLAIEPAPDNFELLRQNVSQNGLEQQITCVRAAVCLGGDSVEFVIDPTDGGKGEVRVDGKQGYAGFPADSRIAEVPAKGLDALVAEHDISPGHVVLVWSDVQGREGDVVASGTSLWKAGVPLFAELWLEGLEAHGGLERFLTVLRESFVSFVTREDLVAQGPAARPRPIADLDPILTGLDGKHTDALFLPGRV
jgi:FkbM family methyltransferase